MSTEHDSSDQFDAPIAPDVTFVKLAGVAGILAALTIIAIFALMVLLPKPETTTTAGKLAHMAEHTSMLRISNGLYPLLHLFLLVFFVGLTHMLDTNRSVPRFGLAAGVLGIVFFLLTAIIFDGRIQLASAYVAADEATKAVIVSTIPVLNRVQLAVSIAGHVFAWGLGVAAFSVAILRTSLLSRWIGWLGILFALTAWLNIPRLVWDAFGPMLLVMDAIGVIWLIAVGISFLRYDEDRIDSHRTAQNSQRDSTTGSPDSTGTD